MNVFDRFKELPPRRLFGPPALLIALGLCVWATLARGLFDGVTLLAGMCGVLSLGLLLLPSRPRLQVLVRDTPDPTRLDLVPTWSVRPLDKQAILQEQVDLALATMPERPEPQLGPDDAVGRILAKTAVAGIQASLSGATDEALKEFESKVSSYEHKLVRWLEQLEKSRGEHLKVFEGELRIRELGHAPADHVHLRLRFPNGFLLAGKLPRAGSPPTRPHFSPGIGSLLPRSALERAMPEIEPIYLPGTDKARYSIEEDAPVIDYELGRVNQHDHRDVPAFSLRVPGPGSYAVQWKASATGLGKPARGKLTIEFSEPDQGEPIITLTEADAEREKLDLT
ncbi:MAG TPA: hypothetical protein VLK89_08345 [Solirubrobacterales bacterium]|nr:hypothetical protein [Solirubrobacterales bacterium]